MCVYVCVCVCVFGASRERPVSLPVQVVNTLLFVRHFCDAAHVPQRVLDPYIPSYVMDAVSISS